MSASELERQHMTAVYCIFNYFHNFRLVRNSLAIAHNATAMVVYILFSRLLATTCHVTLQAYTAGTFDNSLTNLVLVNKCISDGQQFIPRTRLENAKKWKECAVLGHILD